MGFDDPTPRQKSVLNFIIEYQLLPEPFLLVHIQSKLLLFQAVKPDI